MYSCMSPLPMQDCSSSLATHQRVVTSVVRRKLGSRVCSDHFLTSPISLFELVEDFRFTVKMEVLSDSDREEEVSQQGFWVALLRVSYQWATWLSSYD